MRIKNSEHAVVKHYLLKFGKLFVNPYIQSNSINPSLTLFWPFVNRFLTLSEAFVVRDLGVVVPSFGQFCFGQKEKGRFWRIFNQNRRSITMTYLWHHRCRRDLILRSLEKCMYLFNIIVYIFCFSFGILNFFMKVKCQFSKYIVLFMFCVRFIISYFKVFWKMYLTIFVGVI